MSNFSHLEQNIFDSLADCEDSQKSFVRFLDKKPALVAEQFALEVKAISSLVRPWIDFAAVQIPVPSSEDVKEDLAQFILTRHKHWRLAA